MDDNKIIIEVERLLSLTITSKSFVLNNTGGLTEVNKDNISLYNELASVNKRLESLYHEGKITLKEKNEMQGAVRRKYTKLIEKAPKKEESRFGEVLKGMGVDKEALFKSLYPEEKTVFRGEEQEVEMPQGRKIR